MDTDSQKKVGNESVREKKSVSLDTGSTIQSFVSGLWRYRYWLLIPTWAVGCVLFFVFTSEPLPDRVRATASFGIGLGLSILILAIFFHEIGSDFRHVHKHVVQPLGFHFWRYRWRYVLVPTLITSWVGFNSEEYSSSETAGDLFVSRALDGATGGLLIAVACMWAISISYSFATGKVRWLVCLTLFPPLAIIFFFIG